MTQKVGHMTELYREHQFFSETSILLFGSAAKKTFFFGILSSGNQCSKNISH